MKDFIAPETEALLQSSALNSFEALWQLETSAVDAPNRKRGGWSTVGNVTIGGRVFFLKKQRNYLTRVPRAPLGELRAKHEFRYIQYFEKAGIPTMSVAFFGERRINGNKDAILLTHELDGWRDLDGFLPDWAEAGPQLQRALIEASGVLAQKLHKCKLLHRCFYPKHIFVKPDGNGFDTCLIDLEKARRMYIGKHGYLRDLYDFWKRVKNVWTEDELKLFLGAYLATESGAEIETLLRKVSNYHAK